MTNIIKQEIPYIQRCKLFRFHLLLTDVIIIIGILRKKKISPDIRNCQKYKALDKAQGIRGASDPQFTWVLSEVNDSFCFFFISRLTSLNQVNYFKRHTLSLQLFLL